MVKVEMKLKKTLCEIKQNEIKDLEDELILIIKTPKYMCKKCLRAASIKNYLCKPKKIK